MTRTQLSLLPWLLLLGGGCYASHGRAPDAAPPVVIDASTRPDAPIPDPVDVCAPMDARGDGLCDRFIGWAWTGSACEGVGGCDCAGRDCGALFREQEDCVRVHAACVPPGAATPGCSSKGGRAWSLEVDASCGGGPGGLTVALAGDLVPGARFEIDGFPDGSSAQLCGLTTCTALTGVLTVRSFDPDVGAVVDYDLRGEAGLSRWASGRAIRLICGPLPDC